MTNPSLEGLLAVVHCGFSAGRAVSVFAGPGLCLTMALVTLVAEQEHVYALCK